MKAVASVEKGFRFENSRVGKAARFSGALAQERKRSFGEALLNAMTLNGATLVRTASGEKFKFSWKDLAADAAVGVGLLIFAPAAIPAAATVAVAAGGSAFVIDQQRTWGRGHEKVGAI